MNFLVQRTLRDGTATLGELFLDSVHECYTLEPANPIQAGTYDLTIRHSHRFNRPMPHVENVPGHTGILIHWGNWAKDTVDCLLVGRTEAVDFIGHSITEFDVLFQKIQTALRDGPQRITYLDPQPAVDRV